MFDRIEVTPSQQLNTYVLCEEHGQRTQEGQMSCLLLYAGQGYGIASLPEAEGVTIADAMPSIS